MFKRVITVVTAISIIFSCATAAFGAETSDGAFEKRTKALVALGILDGDMRITETSPIKRGDFLKMVCNFYDTEYDSEEEYAAFAETMGIIVSAEDYDYEKEITYNEAVKMLVEAAGFGSYAYLKGGYPAGYLNTARDIGLTDGIKSSEATASVLTELLYNALSADVAKADAFSGETFSFEKIKDGGVLSLWRDISKVSGTVTATELTSLVGDDRLAEGDIAIDGVVYSVVGEYPENVIGLPVTAWIYGVGDEQEIRYLELDEKYLEVLEIADEDIENVPDKCSYVSYKKGNREKKADLSPIIKVIYNGVFYKDYTSDDLMPETGKLTLIDTDRDGDFDVVFIDSYEVMLVDRVSLIDRKVTGMFGYTGSLKELELDSDSDKYRFKITKNGEAVTLGSLAKYDVLNVARSKNGFNIEVIVSSAEPVSANVQGSDEAEKLAYVVVDGVDTEYDVSKVYYRASEESIAGLNTLEPGKVQNLYFDLYGRIVAVKNAAEGDMQYVWAVKCRYYEGEDGPEIALRYLTSDDDWVSTVITAEKIKLNGTRRELEIAAGELGAGANFTEKLMMIKTDKDGIVTEIKTPTASDKYIADTFTESSKYTMTYRSPALYTSGNANVFYPSSGATVFIVPPAGTAFSEDNYIVMTGYFSYNQSYDVKAYNLDEFLCSDIFVVETTSDRRPVTTTNKYLLITKTGKKLTSDDDAVTYIRGDLGDYKNIELTVSEKNAGVDLSDLKCGDYIIFNLDRDGRAVNIEKLVDYSEGIVKEEKRYRGYEYKVNSGVVTKVGSDNSMITLDFGTGTLPFKISNSCYLYDDDTGTVSKATIADISVGDFVAVTRDAYSLTTYAFIIYK